MSTPIRQCFSENTHLEHEWTLVSEGVTFACKGLSPKRCEVQGPHPRHRWEEDQSNGSSLFRLCRGVAEPDTHTHETLTKVYQGLAEAGVVGQQAVDAVSMMQNRGILFRERS